MDGKRPLDGQRRVHRAVVCYEQASTLVTSNLPFNEWTEIFGSERLTGALLDRLTHHVHIRWSSTARAIGLEHSSAPAQARTFAPLTRPASRPPTAQSGRPHANGPSCPIFRPTWPAS